MSFTDKSYKALQKEAKKVGIRANLKKTVLVEKLTRHYAALAAQEKAPKRERSPDDLLARVLEDDDRVMTHGGKWAEKGEFVSPKADSPAVLPAVSPRGLKMRRKGQLDFDDWKANVTN